MTISAEGSSIRNAVAAAKRLLGNPKLRAVLCSGEDTLYRVTLDSGDVVEVTVRWHGRAQAQVVA